MAKKIAVILAGAGNKDGSEITEAVSLIISLSALGAELVFFAPNKSVKSKNFLTNEFSPHDRNLMEESARITRSQIKDIHLLDSKEFDGIAIPGGFGVALHFSNWAQKGSKCEVDAQFEKVIRAFHAESKPIAAICIAPALIARVLGQFEVELTVGEDGETASEIKKTGARHEVCPLTDFITDRENKVISTPAYMYDSAKPHEVFKGIQGLAKEFMEMA